MVQALSRRLSSKESACNARACFSLQNCDRSRIDKTIPPNYLSQKILCAFKKSVILLPQNGMFYMMMMIQLLSHIRLLVGPWTVAHQASLSMVFSRQEYWSGQPFPSAGDLPNPEIELRTLSLQADSLPAEPQRKPKNTGVGSLSLFQGLFPTQRLKADSLLSEPPGKSEPPRKSNLFITLVLSKVQRQ